jgi:hypothetical protein
VAPQPAIATTTATVASAVAMVPRIIFLLAANSAPGRTTGY